MKFKKKKVEEKVEKDLLALDLLWSEWREHHRVELHQERFHEYPSVGRAGRTRWLWVVLDERPGSADGLLIVYCPRRDEYGLATKPRGQRWGSFDGFFGELQQTLGSM